MPNYYDLEGLNYYYDPEGLEKLAQRIAQSLGNDWSLDKSQDWGHMVVIKGQDGTAIHINPNGDRLVITGQYPPWQFIQDLDTPRITVSAGKNAATIAKDICRRFLPDYLAVCHRAIERQRRHEKNEARRHAQLQQLARIMGTEARNGRIYVPDGPVDYGTVEMRSPDSVDFSLGSVSFETACKIAALLKEPAS